MKRIQSFPSPTKNARWCLFGREEVTLGCLLEEQQSTGPLQLIGAALVNLLVGAAFVTYSLELRFCVGKIDHFCWSTWDTAGPTGALQLVGAESIHLLFGAAVVRGSIGILRAYRNNGPCWRFRRAPHLGTQPIGTTKLQRDVEELHWMHSCEPFLKWYGQCGMPYAVTLRSHLRLTIWCTSLVRFSDYGQMARSTHCCVRCVRFVISLLCCGGRLDFWPRSKVAAGIALRMTCGLTLRG